MFKMFKRVKKSKEEKQKKSFNQITNEIDCLNNQLLQENVNIMKQFKIMAESIN